MPSPARIFLGLSLLALGIRPAAAGSAERWTQYANTGEITVMADAGGQVWLGTLGGLIRIDRVTAETTYFNQANSGLTDLRIQSLASDGNGTIAAVTRHGALAVFDGRSWTRPGTEAPLRGQFFLDALWDATGSFWVLATDPQSGLPSVFRKRNSQWTRFFLDGIDRMSVDGYGGYGYSPYLSEGLRLPRLQTDRQGTLWASVMNRAKPKVFRLDPDGSMDTVPAPDGKGISGGYGGPNIQFVVPDSGTPVWLEPQVMLQVSPGGDTIRLPKGVYANYFFHPRNRCARAPDGSELWSFVPGMIHRLRSGVWDSLPPLGSKTSRPPLLLQAHGGKGPGLRASSAYASLGALFGPLDGDAWTPVNVAKTPIPGAGVITQFSGGAGAYGMLLMDSKGIETFDSRAGAFAPFYALPSDGSPRIKALFADHSGRVWASGDGALGLFRQGTLDILKPDLGYWYGAAESFMAEGRDGTLWFADSSGLRSSRRGSEDTRSWIKHPLPASLIGRVQIAAIGIDRDGGIWIAANHAYDTGWGVAARFDGRTWRVHDSLSIGSDAQSIWGLRCDSAGNVWIRFRQGLLQWNGTAWKSHTWSSSPLLATGIEAMAIDGRGTLWAATAAPEASLLKWEEGWRALPDASGKIGTSTIRSMAFDKEGRLWMAPDQGGVLVLDPSTATVPAKGPSGGDAPAQTPVSGRFGGSWRIVLPGTPADAPGARARRIDIQGRSIPPWTGL